MQINLFVNLHPFHVTALPCKFYTKKLLRADTYFCPEKSLLRNYMGQIRTILIEDN